MSCNQIFSIQYLLIILFHLYFYTYEICKINNDYLQVNSQIVIVISNQM